jgi:hypothetical protein
MMAKSHQTNAITDPSPPPVQIISPAPKWPGGGDGKFFSYSYPLITRNLISHHLVSPDISPPVFSPSTNKKRPPEEGLVPFLVPEVGFEPTRGLSPAGF